MPTNIECPTCKTALEISAELMGKKIKCPECKTIFTATIGETAGSTTSEAEVRIRRKPPTPSNEDAKYEEDQEEQEEETIRVRKRSIRQRDEDVEEYEEDEDDEEEELSRRRRRRLASPRQKARSIALAPAISLIVVGVLSILSAFTGIIGMFTGDKPPESGFIPIMVIITISQLCMATATILGAFHFKNLTSYGYATMASIVALLPCSFCIVAGLPVGVWSLITINRSDVKPYFRPT